MGNKEHKVILVSPIVKIAAGLIIIAGLMAASSIFLPLLLALFMSIICAQPVSWLTKRKIPASIAITIVLIGVGLVIFSLGTVISNSMAQFTSNMPVYVETLNGLANTLGERLDIDEFGFSIDQALERIDTAKILSFTSSMLGQLGSLMSNSFLILLIVVFMLAEMGALMTKARIVERDYDWPPYYFREIGHSVRRYLSLKTIICLITGVLISVSLIILGVDYPILWGVVAFLLNYIPNIGSIIAAVPTMLLALVQLGFGGFIWTGVIYLLVNTLMGNIIEPRFMGKELGLSTLVVFLSLIVWGYVFGPIGMFLSVPITLSIKIILDKKKSTRWFGLLLGSEKEANRVYNSPTEEKKGSEQ